MDNEIPIDYLDLLHEHNEMLKQIRQLKADLSMWSRIGHMAFTHNEGCLPGCRRACMCTCGYEHYVAQLAQEERRV